MKSTRRWGRVLPAFAAALTMFGIPGCGLISSDIASFDLALPKQEFVLDTARWGLPAGTTVPVLPCTQTSMCQMLAPGSNPNPMVCGSGGTCEARVDVTATVPYDLKSTSEFAVLNDQPIVSVGISKVQYEVKEETLTVATQPVNFYIAPANVMDAALGMQFATMPALPVGTAPGVYDVMMTVQGKQIVADTIKNYKVPFNILVKTATPMVIKSGEPSPQGRLAGDHSGHCGRFALMTTA